MGSDCEGWDFDGGFTQPVFNDQHGLIRTASPTPPLFRSRCPFLIEIKRIVYQARP